jgi:hypothetical protein
LGLFVMLVSTISLAQNNHPRVYVEAIFGHVYLRGVDHAVPRLDDASMHNQTMELAKTFLQRCPEATLTMREDKADFKVSLNWAAQTRFFMLGKLIHKPDQIVITNNDGDIVYSGVARSLGGDTEAACKVIMASHKPIVATVVEPAAERVTEQSAPPVPAPTASAAVAATQPAGAIAAYQCSEFSVDRLGMKNCTKWVLK